MAANQDLKLDAKMRCGQIMLLSLSFMFAATGILLIMVGSSIQAMFNDLQQFIEGHFLSPAALLMAVGFILLFVAALAAYGSIKQSVMLINLFGVCLLLCFILLSSASIAGFVVKGQVSEVLEKTMLHSMADYENNGYTRFAVDFMQKSLECCGIDGPKDWLKYMDYTNISMEHGILVPYSCCGVYILDQHQNTEKCADQYQNGCFDRMKYIISETVKYSAYLGILAAVMQISGAVTAFMLAKNLRHHKSMREARRWQLQQNLDILLSGGKTAVPVNSPTTGYAQLESDPITYTPNSPSIVDLK